MVQCASAYDISIHQYLNRNHLTWPLDSGVHFTPFLDSLHSNMPHCDCHNANCNRTSQTNGGHVTDMHNYSPIFSPTMFAECQMLSHGSATDAQSCHLACTECCSGFEGFPSCSVSLPCIT